MKLSSDATEEESKVNEDSVNGNFKKFRISKSSRKILKSRGITHLFPIQYMTFDGIYDGKDAIGQARMSLIAGYMYNTGLLHMTTKCIVVVVKFNLKLS